MHALLEVSGLSKSYGALAAASDVDLTVHEHETHALIGPNGAGKTTTLALIAGDTRPDAGAIVLAGRDIAAEPAERRAHLGIARSYQVAQLLEETSVRDNVVLAVQACSPWAWCGWRRMADIAELEKEAMLLLERVGLGHSAAVAAGMLSHGERRKLELAMALAPRPRLLLLDEPLAGMGIEEARATIALLRRLRSECAILLVEHDVAAVFALADRISVLVNGRVVARGTPEEIRRDATVRDAYLGVGTPVSHAAAD
jgi:branched-chain amino acid transport system ATP-binding protein